MSTSAEFFTAETQSAEINGCQPKKFFSAAAEFFIAETQSIKETQSGEVIGSQPKMSTSADFFTADSASDRCINFQPDHAGSLLWFFC